MDNLFSLLKKHEGLRLKPYFCTAKKLTIGYGRNLDAKWLSKIEIENIFGKKDMSKEEMIKILKEKGITNEQAEFLLNNDISDCMADLRKNLSWFDEIDSVRQDVLINMCFNLGIYGLLKFKNTLNMIKNKKYEEASKGMLQSLWAKQVGNRSKELSELMKIGEYK